MELLNSIKQTRRQILSYFHDPVLSSPTKMIFQGQQTPSTIETQFIDNFFPFPGVRASQNIDVVQEWPGRSAVWAILIAETRSGR
jgi:hypothetical protein